MKRAWASFGAALLGSSLLAGSVPAAVIACDETSLRLALSAGGQITFGCDGVIVLSSPLIVTQNVFSMRRAANSTGGNPAQGGAILNVTGTLTVQSSEFTGNSAVGNNGVVILSQVTPAGHGEGGAISVVAGQATIAESTFDANRAQGGNGCCPGPPGPAAPGAARGGAIYTRSPTSIRNATFVRNWALAGGGVFFPLGAGAMGGAIACDGGEAQIQFSTIASNAVNNFTNSARGGGVVLCGGTSHIIASILSGNTTNEAFGENVFPASINGGFNLSSDSTGGPAANTLLNTDPLLGAPGDNGGPVRTMELLARSPAIDATANCINSDARGVPRGQPGGQCDIGAFEQTFLAIQPINETNVLVRYLGVPGELYALQTSSNLFSWQELATQRSAILFPRHADQPREFVRVKFLP